jgi:aryl-alcohol dehydrogenase-like predicted oxidoreductase
MAHEAIDTAIVGTHNPRHMQMNLDWLENDLPIPAATVAELQRRFDTLDDDWVQLG